VRAASSSLFFSPKKKDLTHTLHSHSANGERQPYVETSAVSGTDTTTATDSDVPNDGGYVTVAHMHDAPLGSGSESGGDSDGASELGEDDADDMPEHPDAAIGSAHGSDPTTVTVLNFF
jgi:hypothetical protein